MTDAEIIEVVRAHMEGKQIQYRSCSGEIWNDMLSTHIGWDFRTLVYRVKPEPRKPRVWMLAVIRTPAGDIAAHPDYLNVKDVTNIESVRVREIIEE